MLVNEELLIVLRQPQSTGSSRSICLATSGLEVKTSVSLANDQLDAQIFNISIIIVLLY
jgi:hypothetical protein